ncbi:DUF3524 domain-containing protein [bacterium]|nr:DUF3524 domain-containing protein [bacterium]
MHILLIEPYFTGSHARWADGYKAHSSHQIEILSLQGQYWKWRMHGGAITLAGHFNQKNNMPDLILATDMLDLTTFLALTRTLTADIPTCLYFHENQLVYPWSPTDRDILHKRDRHYAFINYASAMAAHSICFNSSYHMQSFISALKPFLRHFPDHRGLKNIQLIEEKSRVLHLGLDLAAFDKIKPMANHNNKVPLILWNHRWEYDKNPESFFNTLFNLADNGLAFDLAILGENFSQKPKIFEEARTRLGSRIVQYGFAESFEEYSHWLRRADILPVTSNHDFFGASVAEAIYCGCTPILPRRLAYPELLNPDIFPENYYNSEDELKDKLKVILNTYNKQSTDYSQAVLRFDWSNMSGHYDSTFESLI